MLHVLLRFISGINSLKGVYAVESSNDDCMLALGHFLTDGGSQDKFKDWIESTDEGQTAGKVVYIKKFGDQMQVALEPTVTNKKATLVTNKFELLEVINRFKQLITDSPSFILIRRDNGKIVLEQRHQISKGPMAHFE